MRRCDRQAHQRGAGQKTTSEDVTSYSFTCLLSYCNSSAGTGAAAGAATGAATAGVHGHGTSSIVSVLDGIHGYIQKPHAVVSAAMM